MCVHRTVHNCCTEYCTEQTWLFSPLHSRQSPHLRWCLFEGRGVMAQKNSHENTRVIVNQQRRHRVWYKTTTHNFLGHCAASSISIPRCLSLHHTRPSIGNSWSNRAECSIRLLNVCMQTCMLGYSMRCYSKLYTIYKSAWPCWEKKTKGKSEIHFRSSR